MVRVLIAATKPPWPPVDGGRVLLWNSLQAVHGLGVEVILVAPFSAPEAGAVESASLGEVAAALAQVCEPHLVPIPPEARGLLALRALGRPLTVARHTRWAVRAKLDELLDRRSIGVVHAEQLQALPQTEGARLRGLPVVLRAQNVESDLWRLWAGRSGGARGALLRVEGRRLAAWEGRAVTRAAETWALSREDAARLSRLASGLGRVVVIPPPFPLLPRVETPLEGAPAVVLMGSRGWRPNEDAVRWFLGEVWPAVLRAEPGAILHLYGNTNGEGDGGAAPGVRRYPAPRDSATAFPAGSIQAVPLRVGSGVRIKILEAWARGIPVVGTPQAFAGLEIEAGREGLIASGADDFAQAIAALHRDPALARVVTEGAGERLRGRHSPAAVGRQMAEAYARLEAESLRLRTRR